MKKLIFATIFICLSVFAYPQLNVAQTMTPQQMVQNVLVGYGVTVSNISFTGNMQAIGTFSNGGTTNLGITSGIVISSGKATDCVGPNISGSKTTNNNAGSDPQLAALATSTVNDAAVLEFDFVPIADTIKFKYVFGSDEYPEFVNSSFNDIFGFFVTGPNPAGPAYVNKNIAIIPNTSLPVTINNVNNGTSNNGPCNNCSHYVNNVGGITIEYDGLTTVLTAIVRVIPCQTYHFKAAVGDVGDASYDSGVFLEANSFISTAVQVSTKFSIQGALSQAIEGCNTAIISAKLPKAVNYDTYVPIDTMWGTATNGVDFPLIPDTIIILAGTTTTNINLTPFQDGLTEPTEDFNMVFITSPCTIDTVSIPILDYTPIQIVNFPSDTMVCQDTAVLWASFINGMAPFYFSWTPTTAVFSPTANNTLAFPPQTTTYTFSITDTTGCPAVIDSFEVKVGLKPSVSFAASKYSGCEPLEVIFTDYSSPSIANWNWNFGDGGTSNIQNPSHVFSNGSYDISLDVLTQDGCPGNFAVTNLIKSWVTPNAFFEANPDVAPIDNPTIDFLNLSAGGMLYNWDFGDFGSPSNTSTDLSPSHTYTEEGEYQVILIVSTDHGCADTAIRNVMIVVDSISIPNVITPNGDGVNDVFKITNIERLEYSRLKIYNRWGAVVYEKENYVNDWDGQDLSDGVYFYTLEYHTYFRKDKAQGTVTILRK